MKTTEFRLPWHTVRLPENTSINTINGRLLGHIRDGRAADFIRDASQGADRPLNKLERPWQGVINPNYVEVRDNCGKLVAEFQDARTADAVLGCVNEGLAQRVEVLEERLDRTHRRSVGLLHQLEALIANCMYEDQKAKLVELKDYAAELEAELDEK